ncbi:MAG: hypothetical protein COS99_00005 [Candidatus Omnitrophica bacterium CG07_land_8_20_14_0_80_42_15]|uniref:DUF5666 domain-containing protein n=1 Tax=Candidatus Aquitaenariimonas noxiae TaxID=1974741 RepID=A0A2J0L5A0_9BACT|nr:MAG: hypothetical protein COS99_00005 [Candidatus Omnitrophica bacterium CG07_land_8_20_14_0_80_42_15]
MNRYFGIATVLALSLLVCFSVGISIAQEEGTEYSYGTVSKMAADQIVVSEYDYDKDAEVEVTYLIDPKVELENVTAVGDIAVGDAVEIEYVAQDGKKTAKAIVVEKALEEEAPAAAPEAKEGAAEPAPAAPAAPIEPTTPAAE